MRSRCSNPRSQDWPHYGARGIRVCDEWCAKGTGFPAYLAHVSQLPHYGEPGYSLDRIDNDGNYEPGNVRWATKSTQMQNQRPRTCKRRQLAGSILAFREAGGSYVLIGELLGVGATTVSRVCNGVIDPVRGS